MKRNSLTIVAIIASVLLMLGLWIIPGLAFNYTFFANESGDNSIKEDLNISVSFREDDIDILDNNHFFINGQWDGSDFNYLKSDFYTVLKNNSYDNIYQHFPIFNRPDLQTMVPLQIDEGQTFWHKSYPDNYANGVSTYKYTVLDTDKQEFISQTYDIPARNFEVLNYIKIDNTLYILFSLFQANDISPKQIMQLSIDLASGNVTKSQTLELANGDIAYGNLSDPESSSKHFLQVIPEEEWNLRNTSSTATTFNEEQDISENYILIDPISLQIQEIADLDSGSDYNRWYYANDQVFIMEHVFPEATSESFLSKFDLIIYQLDLASGQLEEYHQLENINHFILNENILVSQELKSNNSQIQSIRMLDLNSLQDIYNGDLVLKDGYAWNNLVLY